MQTPTKASKPSVLRLFWLLGSNQLLCFCAASRQYLLASHGRHDDVCRSNRFFLAQLPDTEVVHRHDSWYLAQLSDDHFALSAGWCASKQDMAASKSCLRWLVASCEKRISLLTKRKSAACDHNRYAHRHSRIGIESVRRSYEHHDESCSDDSKVVQHISRDMDDDSIDSQIAMRMFF